MAMGVGVAVPEEGDSAAAAIVGGAEGEAPLVAAGKEPPPPTDGLPAVEVEGKGAEPPLEGAPTVTTVEREEEAHKTEGKNEAEAEAEPEDGVPAAQVEGMGAAAPLEGAPAVITVEREQEALKNEGKKEAEAEPEPEAKAGAEAEEEDEGEKWLGHYSSGQSILIVGDGDFSFSLALATAFGSGANLVATSLDTYEALRGKYSKAESNIMELKRLGATVLHGVDAKKMKFHTDLKNSRFDRIVFNFPHAGFKGKENDMHMINLHKELLWGFFFNARHLVRRYGEIHVTHKTGHPYDRWDLEHLASGSSLAMVEKVAFRKEDYPGYNQKRGDSARCDKPFNLGACCTFKFQIGDLKKLKKMNGQRAGSIPNLGCSNIHRQHFRPQDNTGNMLMPLPPYMGDQRPQPGFPPNSDGMVRALYFPQHYSFHPLVTMPGPWPNALPPPGGVPPPMSRISWPNLHAPHEQHWYQQRTAPNQLRGDSYFSTREYEIQRQVMPGATGLNRSAFLGHHHMDRESVQKLEWLRWMIALARYGRP